MPTNLTFNYEPTSTDRQAIISGRDNNMLKVLIADAQPMVRKGLRMRLATEGDVVIVGEASDGIETERLTQETHPDVVILDANMPKTDGFTTTFNLRAFDPHLTIILLSLRGDPAMRIHAQKVGADAFIEKQEGAEKLLETIQQIRKMKGYQDA